MVKITSFDWRHLIILMFVYVSCSQTALYFSPIICTNAKFSINNCEFKDELFSVNFTLYASMPLDVKVDLIPVIEEPTNLPVYIFYDPNYPALGTSWETIHMLGTNLRRELPLSCLLYTSPSPRDLSTSRMPSSA